MNMYVENLELMQRASELQNVSTLDGIQSVKENIFIPTNIEKMSIEKGLKDFQQGKVHPHSQVKQRYEKWL